MRGVLWALGSALMAAAFVIPWKLANQQGDPDVSVLLMLTVAAAVNTALLPWLRRPATHAAFSTRTGWVALQLALLTLLGNIAQAHAIVSLSPSVLSVALRSEVLLIALFAWLWLGERVDRRFWAGAAVAGAGLLFMQQPEAKAEAGLSGLTLALLAAAAFGTMAVVLRKHVAEVDLSALNSTRLWLSIVLWLIVQGELPEFREVPLLQYVYAGLAALFGPLSSRMMMMASARYIEARLTALIALSAPVFALLLSHMLLDDVPAPRQIAGGAIMLMGIAVPAWPRASR